MIIFCYGIPKSASSFVFQLTGDAVRSLEKTGRLRCRRLDELFVGFPPTDFAEAAIREGLRIDEPKEASDRDLYLDELFRPLLEKMRGRTDQAVVIKTHRRCTPAIASEIGKGTVLASATFRHPAEMILSRIDMARRDGEILTYDVREAYKGYIKDFYSWATLPQVREYYFDEIATDPASVYKDICQHVCISGECSDSLSEYLANKKERIREYNKGMLRRHLSEMTAEEVSAIEDYFADFIDYIRRHNEKRGRLRAPR